MMPTSRTSYRRVASLKTPDAFGGYLDELGVELGFDGELQRPAESVLAQPFELDGVRVGNRFCVLPMEGWDGTRDGRPSELTTRRWRNFGRSGAKLIWGGEAVAVRADGRANPNQLLITEETLADLAALREALVAAHVERCGSCDDLYIGLQLTHSGRFARPHESGRPEPRIVYHHPILDRRLGLDDRYPCVTDAELDRLVEDFVHAGERAWKAGFQFVDLKHCHGYLGHELLSAFDRPGQYGGSFEHRTRFLREIVGGLRARVPRLGLAVRVSVFDTPPYRKGAGGVGVNEADEATYASAFGLLRSDERMPDLTEADRLLELLTTLDVRWVCITAGSPYYSPHIQRPALFPPSDGYLPPEDPLVGVARQIAVTARLKRCAPRLAIVGSGYSYLQEWLPHVAQHAVRTGGADFIGLGRIVLSYPDLPADILAGRPLRTKSFCRTFSDCTSGPRNGLVSGCFPLDPFYAAHPHAALLKASKTGGRAVS
jgi:2,4-dienoyl-CoA reductase-like NADH-dependent reductase (Old Yellow Enzyme family)